MIEHNRLRYESPEDWAAGLGDYYVRNIKPLLYLDSLGRYPSPVSGLIAHAVLRTRGDLDSVLRYVLDTIKENKEQNIERAARYKSPTGLWYAELIDYFGEEADDKVRIVVSWYMDRRAFTEEEKHLVTSATRRHSHKQFKEDQAERIRRWKQAARLRKEGGEKMRHVFSAEWEPVKAEDAPGLWYVIERIEGYHNQLRIGPMHADLVGLAIAERQDQHERLMKDVLENLGIYDPDIHTNYNVEPIDKRGS